MTAPERQQEARKKMRTDTDGGDIMDTAETTTTTATEPPPPPTAAVRCHLVAKDGVRVPISQPVVNMLATIKSALSCSGGVHTSDDDDDNKNGNSPQPPPPQPEDVAVVLVESASTLRLLVDFCENYIRDAADDKARKKWQNETFGENVMHFKVLQAVMAAANMLGLDARPAKRDKNGKIVNDDEDKKCGCYPLNELVAMFAMRIITKTPKQIFAAFGGMTLSDDDVKARLKEAHANPNYAWVRECFPLMSAPVVAP
jgi:hypothetical protein